MHAYTIHFAGSSLGPVSEEELLEKIRAGEVPLDALAWRPGLAEWAPLDRVLAADGLMSAELLASVPPSVKRTAPIPGFVAPPKPDNWLVPAIISTLCCCIPLGIPAIIFAVKVDSEYKAGDYEAARAASGKAKLFFWLAFGLGLIANLVGFALQFLMARASAAGNF